MNPFGEDGPEYKGDRNFGGDIIAEAEQNMKNNYIKHFMLDFMEMSLRKVVHENSL